MNYLHFLFSPKEDEVSRVSLYLIMPCTFIVSKFIISIEIFSELYLVQSSLFYPRILKMVKRDCINY